MDKLKLASLNQDLKRTKAGFHLDNFFIHMTITIFETFYVEKTNTHKTFQWISFLQKNSSFCVQKNILKNSDGHVLYIK